MTEIKGKHKWMLYGGIFLAGVYLSGSVKPALAKIPVVGPKLPA